MKPEAPQGTIKGLRAYVKSVFDLFDEDQSNNIDAEEFRKLCIELGYFFESSEVRPPSPLFLWP